MTNRKQEGIPVRVSQRRLLETMDGIHKEIVEVATEHYVVTFCRKRLDELIKDYEACAEMLIASYGGEGKST